MVDLLPGTEFVSAQRLTTKYYKFILPAQLQSYDWVISFDDNVSLDLNGLAPLIAAHASRVLILIDWRHFLKRDAVRSGSATVAGTGELQ